MAGAMLVLFPVAANAHAVLEETNPVDGAVLDAAPPEVTLQFNEIVSVRDGAVNVIGPDGDTVEVDDVRVIDRAVHIALPAGLDDGSYVVSWRVISADSHPVAGALAFSIGAPSAGVVLPSSLPGSEDGLGWRTIRAAVTSSAYLGALVAIGLTIFATFAHDGGPERDRLRRLAFAAAVLGATGIAASIPVQVVDFVGDGLSGLDDGTAWSEVVRGAVGAAALVSIVGLVVVIFADRRLGHGPVAGAVVGAGAAVALGGFAVSGHTRTFGPWWLVVTSDLVHLVAAAVWLGGLVGLAVTLRARRHGVGGATPGSTAAVIGRFSTLAAVCLVSVAAFGVVLGWRIVGSWDALLDSDYGTVLLVKVGLVAVVALLGGYNRFRLVPHASRAEPGTGRHRLSRVVRVEAALLVAVVVATGLLVNTSPTATASPTPATGQTEPADGEQVLDVELGDITARLTIDPVRTGTNQIVITLHDRAGVPVDALEPPTLEATQAERGIGPLSHTASRTGTGTYEVRADLPVPGRWDIRVSARMSAYSRPIGATHVDLES